MIRRPIDVFPGSRRLVRGVVPPSALLLIGPTGIGKTTFCKHFIYNGLRVGNPGIYVTTEESPRDIETSMAAFGFDVQPYLDNGMLRIVDCYSWKVGNRSASDFVITNPHNYVTDMTLTIENARQQLQNIHLVFDSLTEPSNICDPNAFSKFLQKIVADVRSVQGKAIFTIASGTLGEYAMNNLRTAFDGILEMQVDETGTEIKRLIRIFSIKGARHTTSWTPFEITDKGIIVKRNVDLRCALCSTLIEWEPHVETIDGKTYHFDTLDCLNTYKKFKNLYGQYFE